MATIRKRNEKWHVQIRLKGSPATTRTFTMKADALAWARQKEAELEREDIPSANGKRLSSYTLRDLILRYLDEVVPQKRSAKNETAVLRAFLRRPIAAIALDALGASDFASYRETRLEEVTGGTVRREFVILRHCLEIARREWGVPLRKNPAREVKLPADARPRERRLEADEALRLSAAIEAAERSLATSSA